MLDNPTPTEPSKRLTPLTVQKLEDSLDVICALYERWMSNLQLMNDAVNQRPRGRFGIASAASTDEYAKTYQDLDARNRELKASIEENKTSLLSHIQDVEREKERLRAIVSQMQNLAQFEYRLGGKYDDIQLDDRIGWRLTELGKPEENIELSEFLKQQETEREKESKG